MNTERIPPSSREAERGVLGAILRDCEILDELTLVAEQFHMDAHQKLYRGMQELWLAGVAVDHITLGEWVSAKNLTQDIGGMVYLVELLDCTPTTGNVLHHAEIVRQKAILRSLINVATETMQEAYSPSGPADEMLSRAEASLLSISSLGITGQTTPIKDVVDGAMKLMDRRKSDPDQDGIKTGLLDLDAMMGGFHDGELTILAARPSVGKSSLARHFIRHAAGCGAPCFMVSLEMSENEIGTQMLCTEARVDSVLVRKGMVPKGDVDKILEASERLRVLPVEFDATACQRIGRIAGTARRLKRKIGLRLVCVDYLQLIEPDNSSESRERQVSDISRRCKLLAKELDIPVIALAQLNRQVEGRAEQRPRLSDLRDSGSLEQDADTVIFLWRPNPQEDGLVEAVVAKQRNGPTGEVPLCFLKQYTRFENFAVAAPPYRGY
jgi:replicative DNA helicase